MFLLVLVYSLQVTVQEFIKDPDKEAVLSVGSDMRKINYCFQLLKVKSLV
jgi:hypothetical protein